jgi:toxin YoeB
MNKSVIFTPKALEDFWYWHKKDKKTLRRVYQLIEDTQRNGYHGIGKPEPLTGSLSGYWSKRIDERNRMVFRITDEAIEIYQCRGHYND